MRTIESLSFTDVRTQEDAERFAAANNVRLTPTDYERIARLKEARLRSAAQAGTPESRRTQMNAWFLQALGVIEYLSEIVMTVAQALIVAFGVPTALMLLLVVEQQRVVSGIQLFEAHRGLAEFAAWALVLLNLVLEFTIEFIERRYQQEERPAYVFSLRLMYERLAYFLGIQRDWQPQTRTSAFRYRRLLGLVSASILVLALAGSMQTVISETDGAWYEALQQIAVASSLSQLMTWVGGLLFAAVAVFSVQGLSRYIAKRCVEILENMQREIRSGDSDTDGAEAAAVQFILAKVANVQAKKKSKEDSDFLTVRG
ncbi:MAG: hypothetical protein CL607_07460 [Anaerolineaceae bacterium]|nr:hypothetical protein [Anaerolineaceae bacterium]